MNRRYDDDLPSRRIARWLSRFFARNDNDLFAVLALAAVVAVLAVGPTLR